MSDDESTDKEMYLWTRVFQFPSVLNNYISMKFWKPNELHILQRLWMELPKLKNIEYILNSVPLFLVA
jgi:hypothetical protein